MTAGGEVNIRCFRLHRLKRNTFPLNKERRAAAGVLRRLLIQTPLQWREKVSGLQLSDVHLRRLSFIFTPCISQGSNDSTWCYFSGFKPTTSPCRKPLMPPLSYCEEVLDMLDTKCTIPSLEWLCFLLGIILHFLSIHSIRVGLFSVLNSLKFQMRCRYKNTNVAKWLEKNLTECAVDLKGNFLFIPPCHPAVKP